MIKMNDNPSPELLAIGGTMTTVGVGAQVPALGAAANSAVSLFSSSLVGGAVKAGASFACSIAPPVAIIGGLALLGITLLKND